MASVVAGPFSTVCHVFVPRYSLRERVLCETAVSSDTCICLSCLPVNEPINEARFLLLFIVSTVYYSHCLMDWCILPESTARNGWCLRPYLGCCVRKARWLICVPSYFCACAQVCCNIYFTAVRAFEAYCGENAESPVGCYKRIGHFLGHLWCTLKFLQLWCEVCFGVPPPLKTHIAVLNFVVPLIFRHICSFGFLSCSR